MKKFLVRAAGVRGQRVRAVGAQRSHSAVNKTDGLTVLTDRLCEREELGSVASGWDRASLVRVGCGCSVRKLQQPSRSQDLVGFLD